MNRIYLLVVLPSLLTFTLRGDTIELKTGERIEGAFKQATASGAVIEVGGQAITIALEKVKAIYFGAAPSATVAGPAPSQEALDELRALRSVTNSGVTYRDYAQRVLDARVKVDRYLSSQGRDGTEPRRAVRVAMLEYELMRYALNPVTGEKEKSLGAMGKIVGDPDVVAKCAALKDLTDDSLSQQQHQLKDIVRRTAALAWKVERVPHTPDHDDDLGLTFIAKQITPHDMWSCASEQITEAERSIGQH